MLFVPIILLLINFTREILTALLEEQTVPRDPVIITPTPTEVTTMLTTMDRLTTTMDLEVPLTPLHLEYLDPLGTRASRGFVFLCFER